MEKRTYKPVPLSFDVPELVITLALHYDVEGFRVILEEHKSPPTFRRFKISFSSPPFALRMIDEGDYLSTPGIGSGIISLVENSEYLEWFHQESQQVRAGQKLKHYAVYSINECFDIIHSEEPEICEL